MTPEQELAEMRGRVHALAEILMIVVDQFVTPPGTEDREILVSELEAKMSLGFVDGAEGVRGSYVETYRALLRELKI